MSETVKTTQAGITLDIARNYYTVKEIKQYIDTISTNIGKNNGGFLHLHISDNENYGVESKVLGQAVGGANVSYNPAVSEEERVYTYDHNGAAAGGETKFLSTEQLKIIVGYAREKGVEIVPEINSPGHAKGIYNLLTEQGKVSKIFLLAVIPKSILPSRMLSVSCRAFTMK